MRNRSPKSLRRQLGLTAFGWVCILAAISMFVSMALKIGPHYVDNYYIQQIFEGLPAEQIHRMPKADVLDRLRRRFRVEYVDPKVEDILKFKRTGEETLLTVEYTVTEPLFANVSVLLNFKNEWRYEK